MEPRSTGRSVLTRLRCRLAVRHSTLSLNHVAVLSVSTLATSCTSSKSSAPCEAGALGLPMWGSRVLDWVSQAAGGQKCCGARRGISSPEPSLSPTGPSARVPDG